VACQNRLPIQNAFAIASVESGSGVSVGASGFCAAKSGAQSRSVIAQANFMEVSIGRVKFTIARETLRSVKKSGFLTSFKMTSVVVMRESHINK
jgi:hypothetical protein